jgi:gluconokinase
MVVILMGVSGSGKTTIGRMLARALKWEFRDADDLHPPANRARMRSGVALTDEDRGPWLVAVHTLIAGFAKRGVDAVVACSALKAAYRTTLAAGVHDVKFVLLDGSEDLIARRLAARRGHFFDPALLHSQFATLEPPTAAIVVDITPTPAAIVAAICAALGL